MILIQYNHFNSTRFYLYLHSKIILLTSFYFKCLLKCKIYNFYLAVFSSPSSTALYSLCLHSELEHSK